MFFCCVFGIMKTLSVDADDILFVRAYSDKTEFTSFSEIEELKENIYKEFSEDECSVIEIYTTPLREVRASSISPNEEEHDDDEEQGDKDLQIYAIDPKNASFIGLGNKEMKDGVAYFEANPLIQPRIKFDVVEKILGEEEYDLGEETEYDIETSIAPKDNKLLLMLERITDPYILYNMVGNNIAFVTTETLNEINKLSKGEKLNEDGEKLFEEQSIIGVGIYYDRNKEEVSQYLKKCGYSVE